jgi:hypothetical protein
MKKLAMIFFASLKIFESNKLPQFSCSIPEENVSLGVFFLMESFASIGNSVFFNLCHSFIALNKI